MENSDRIYRLYVDPSTKTWIVAQMCIFFGMGIFLISARLFGAGGDWLFVVGVYMIAWGGFPILRSLTFPQSITMSSDGRIEFTSTLRKKVVYVTGIQSIKPEGLESLLVVRANGVRIPLWPQFDGFHDFLARLKAMNPNIELRGC